MIKKIRYKVSIVLLVLISVLGTSCSKWLELKPEDGLIRDDYWKTKEQLKASVMGCYASLLGGSKLPLAKYLFIWGELRGDMVVPGIEVSSDEDAATLNTLKRDELDLIRTQISSDNSLTNWEAIYRTINFCNTVIKFGPEVMESDNTLSETVLKAYLSEVYALRGLMYFYLLRTFGEVPLKLTPTSSDFEIVPIAKSSQEEVHAQIISDLKYAAENGSVTYGNMMEDRGRITQSTAYTILADAYLWVEDYQNCIDACAKVKQSGKYQLFPAGTLQVDWFRNVFVNGNSVESIFEFQFDNQKSNPFWDMFAVSAKEFKAADWIAEGGLYGADINDKDNQDIRGNGTSMMEANGYINKFTGTRTSSTSFTHWFVYRYSDILLMEAEALTWLEPGNVENGNKALSLVNQIRIARNALPAVSGNVVEVPEPGNTEDVSEYIFNERAREFAFEGKRWYDILRNAKRNGYANEKMLLDIVSASAEPSKQQTVINKYKDRRSHYLPIYSYELQTNKALVQNPFYQ